MIYPSDFESKIGFDIVRNIISELCVSSLGKEEVNNISFSSSFPKVKENLQAVSEMVALISNNADIPLNHVYDVRPTLLEIMTEGSYASAEKLFSLLKILITISEVHKFFSNNSDENGYKTILSLRFGDIDIFPTLISSLKSLLTEFGEVRDTASPELYDIRDRLKRARASISSVMRKVMDKAISSGIIEADASPAMRDGRLVIPVAAMSKRSISGIVHDQSATGKTVFVEPIEVVEASNHLRELESEERREIIKILIQTANMIRPHGERISKAVESLGMLDLIHAKGKFALLTGGELPTLSPRTEMEWYNTVNPILFLNLKKQNRKTIPLNITLTKSNRFLIISGPNAGGKSIALKTVGLIQYMTQCGVLPPLNSNSHVGIFNSIFIDIGDEQSLENDLSTYSSHLRNMKVFLQRADSRSLVLADEIGSGTEPQIGGAIAQAILQKLGQAKVFGVVTTHYQNLKSFAAETPGFVNGAMLYDRTQLQPLFQLSIGSPGSSFAIEIAKKTGLPPDVIDNAGNLVGEDYINSDKYLLDISRDKKYWAEKRLKIKELELKVSKQLEDAERRILNLKEQRNKIISEAKNEAENILGSANAQIEKTIREIKEVEAEKEKTKEIRKQLEDYKKKVAKDEISTPEILKSKLKSVKSFNKKKDLKNSFNSNIEVKVGAYVKMDNSSVVGKIISIEGKNAEVAFGDLRTKVKISKLLPSNEPVNNNSFRPIANSNDGNSYSRRLNFKQEIDVRGMRADEALQAVTYFIDDAVQFSAKRVRILHGTGTGALRMAIRELLNASQVVSSFHDEDVRFGGAGITIVNLE